MMVVKPLIVTACLALPCHAQDVTREDCVQLWDEMQGALGATTISFGNIGISQGSCSIDRLAYESPSDNGTSWQANHVLYQGTGLIGAFDPSVAQKTLEMDIRGLRIAPSLDPERVNDLFDLQTRLNKIDVTLALGWDPSTKVLTVSRFFADLPGDNEVEMRAILADVDLSSGGAAQISSLGFSLTDMELIIKTRGLLESVLAVALGSRLLPEDENVDAVVRDLKTQAMEQVAQLPATTFSSDTIAALKQLLGEMPKPVGTLTLSLRADRGFGPVRLAAYAVKGGPRSVKDLESVLEGVAIEVDWPRPVLN